jgi:hypothetical protein
MMRGWIIALVGVALAACTAPPAQETLAPEAPKPQAVQKYVHDTKLDTDAAACAAKHGAIQPVCLRGTPMCVVAFSDAGKACRDGADCQGRCLAEPRAKQPEPVTGKCAASNNPCGCISIVTNGVASPVMCID